MTYLEIEGRFVRKADNGLHVTSGHRRVEGSSSRREDKHAN